MHLNACRYESPSAVCPIRAAETGGGAQARGTEAAVTARAEGSVEGASGG